MEEGSDVARIIEVSVGRYAKERLQRGPRVGFHMDAVGGLRTAVPPGLVVWSLHVVTGAPGVLRVDVGGIVGRVGPLFGLVFFRGAGLEVEGFVVFVFVVLM